MKRGNMLKRMHRQILFGILLFTSSAFAQQLATDNFINNTNNNFFIENKGQWPQEVKYLAKIGGMNAWITDDGVVYDYYKIERNYNEEAIFELPEQDKEKHKRDNTSIKGHVVKSIFKNNNNYQHFFGERQQEAYYNYFLGNDKNTWASYVALYEGASIEELYKGIDIKYYFDEGLLRYDFVVKPGADVSQIKISIEGVDDFSVTDSGELEIETSLGKISHKDIVAYQSDGEVNCEFKKNGNILGFTIENYDKEKELIIDPLVYSTFLGGSEADQIDNIAVDNYGNVFVAGVTISSNYPVTVGAYDETFSDPWDVVITKLNSSGSELLYSTFIGQVNYCDDIIIDEDGNSYVTGGTPTSNFPITTGAYDESANAGNDVFITKLNSSGSDLVFSTFLGGFGEDFGYGLALDDSKNIYVTGQTWSSDYPTTTGSFDESFNGTRDAFVAKISSDGSSLLYSTYLGGSDHELGAAICVDNSGNAIITGTTLSSNYPATSGSFDVTHGGNFDIFVSMLNSDGSGLIFSTFLGSTSGENGYGIKVNSGGSVYVAGYTGSVDYPITSGAFDETYNGGGDIVISKLNASGSQLEYSTFLGGDAGEQTFDLDIDNLGNVFVVGVTLSTNYPITSGAFDETYNGGGDIVISKLNASGSQLEYSTFLGGNKIDGGDGGWERGPEIATDGAGNIFITGLTNSLDFPVSTGAYDESYNGDSFDAFVTKLQISAITLSPRNLAATPGNQQIILSWSSNAESDLAKYRIYSTTDTVSFALIDSVNAPDTSYMHSNLTNGKTYYYKITAIDIAGNESEYSDVVYGTTYETCPGIPTVTYEGKTYNTVLIGDQCWLKENLDIGTMINGNNSQTNNNIIEKYCYDNDYNNCDTYGALYQWNEVVQYVSISGTQGICPGGWHIPTNAELQTLSMAVNENSNALKAITEGFGSGVGTNSSGFSALHAGNSDRNGNFGNLGQATLFYGSSEASGMYISSFGYNIDFTVTGTEGGYSVRCLKDDLIESLTVVSPNGGENWLVGSNQNITWNSQGVENVKIEYTTNNGGLWTSIISSTPASSGSYSWTVPNTVSTQCKIRISNVLDKNLADESNSVFKISDVAIPTIVVISPNGGEKWSIGLSYNIGWMSKDIENVKIEYTTNSGTSWVNIVASTTASSESYAWTVPNTASTKCKVRISDALDENPMDESNEVFTISSAVNPAITITAPDGGENWLVGSNQEITWSSQDVANVKIEYSIDNGSNWTNIIASTPASSESYAWTVPNVESDSCLIRITDVDNVNLYDVSDSFFSINAVPLSPNNLLATPSNKQITLTWSPNTESDLAKYRIYSTIDTASFALIDSVNAPDTSYVHPNLTNGKTYYYKITAIDKIGIESAYSIMVSAKPTSFECGNSTVAYNGKVYNTVLIGDQCWLKENLDVGVRIDGANEQVDNNSIEKYCYDNDTSNCNVYGGLYLWNEAMQYKLTDNTQGICPKGWFLPTAQNLGELKLLADNNSNNLKAVGQGTGGGAGNNSSGFSLLLAGNRYYDTYFSELGSYSYTWTTTSTIGSGNAGCMITTDWNEFFNFSNVDKNDGLSVRCLKDNDIVPLTLTSQNRGGKMFAGTLETITWSSSDIKYAKIDYSTDNGSSWKTVVDSTICDGAYSWVVPNENSEDCLIRISDLDDSGSFDLSDSVFTIEIDEPIIRLTSPVSGSVGNVSPISLVWEKATLADSYHLQISKDADFTTILVDEELFTSSTYSLTHVENLTTYYWRVNGSNVGGAGNWSDVWSFKTLGEPTTVALLSPDNNSINQAIELDFVWSKAMDKLKPQIKGEISSAQFMKKNGKADKKIDGILAVSNYWFELNQDTLNASLVVDSTLSDTTKHLSGLINLTEYYWRVKAKNETGWGGYSNWSKFTTIIDTPSVVKLLSPQNNALGIGNPIEFKWSSSQNTKDYYFALFEDEELTANARFYTLSDTTVIVDSLESLKKYYWYVQTNNLVGFSRSAIGSFTMRERTVVVTLPNGGEKWISGASQNIVWTAKNIDTVKIEYSINNGTNWSVIENAISATTSSYSWVVPEIVSDNCLIRISDIKYSSIHDLSNSVFSIALPPLLTVKSPNGNEVLGVGDQIAISWNSRNVEKLKIESSVNGGESWQSIANDVVSDNLTYAWIIPNTPSVDCFVKISSVADPLVGDQSDNSFVIYPDTLPVVREVSFGDVNVNESFRMIGLPGNANYSISNVLQGEYGNNWKAYYDNGKEGLQSVYLEEYDGSSKFNFKPGVGFWIVADANLKVNETFESVSVNNGYATIPLNSGWNVISNPFELAVKWDDVKTLNNLTNASDVIYSYDGTYSISASFEPFVGYYYLNDDVGVTSMKIPYYTKENAGLAKKIETVNNDIDIELRDDRLKYSSVKLGFREDAKTGFDKYDIYFPRYIGSVGMVVANEMLSNSYLIADYRKEIGEGIEYDLQINVNKNKPYKLKIGGLSEYKDYKAVIIDSRLSKVFYFENEIVTIKSLHNENSFKLLLGSDEFIDNEIKNLIPKEYALYQNYPNPFNPSTVIRFSLPKESKVDLKIYSITGEEVVTLIDNQIIDAGNHEIEFSATSINRRLASGVYFYRIIADKFTDVKKLILLK